jgi:hypothetical protein
MDGHFEPNFTMRALIVGSLRPVMQLPKEAICEWELRPITADLA